MKIERAVVNASPLILLFKGGLADLLPRLFSEVAVPDAVWEEVVAGVETDDAAKLLPSVPWVRRVVVPAIAPEIVVWNLGDGESAVLSFALSRPEYVAVVDDRAARSCARTLGVQTLGTGGLLILAKRRGLVQSVTDELQKLQGAGLWLSNEVIALLKDQAGESG